MLATILMNLYFKSYLIFYSPSPMSMHMGKKGKIIDEPSRKLEKELTPKYVAWAHKVRLGNYDGPII